MVDQRDRAPRRGTRVYPARSETLLNVPRGTLLELSSFAGDIDVEGWDKNSVHVIASHGRRDRLEARLVRGTLVLETSNAAGLPTVVGYQIRVPRWMPLHLSGIDSQISVSGVLSPISAESVKGDVTVRGGSGQMQLSSVEGGIHVLDARGALQATSVNNLVQIQRVVGDLSLESVNGDIQMHGCDSPNVEASSVNGMVVFSGPFQRRGRYRLASHNGRLVVGVPDDAGVDVSVASFNGTFESGFPVQVGRKIKNRKFGFTIGSGGSSLELESYQGLIQLLRPRALPAPPAPLSPKAPLPPVPPEER